MTGVRHVNFAVADWIADTFNLSIDERGVYLTAWELICGDGGPISRDDLRHACPGDKRRYTRAVDGLLGHGKLIDIDGTHFGIPRCEVELERAQNRIEIARENGSKSRGSVVESSRNSRRTAVKNARKSEAISSKTADFENPAGPLHAREAEGEAEAEAKEEEVRYREPRAREAPPNSEFESWFEEYGHRVDRPAALIAYREARRIASAGELLLGARRYVESKPPDRNWLNPATWLRQERWRDQPAQQPTLLMPLNGGRRNERGKSAEETLVTGFAASAASYDPGKGGRTAEPLTGSRTCRKRSGRLRLTTGAMLSLSSNRSSSSGPVGSGFGRRAGARRSPTFATWR